MDGKTSCFTDRKGNSTGAIHNSWEEDKLSGATLTVPLNAFRASAYGRSVNVLT